jgi:hypothetical protein
VIKKLLLIPDTQVKPGVETDHLRALGEFIVEERPDAIVHIGDHWDMPSLSSYDRGTAKSEGRRVREDIEAGNRAMQLLLAPLRNLQSSQRANRKRVYTPEMHFTVGNHEERITRYENHHPEVQGALGWNTLDFTGWTVHPFLQPIVLGGVEFCHYFYSPLSGKPYGGSAEYSLGKIKRSFVQGHEQGFKYHIEAVGDRRIHGLVAGSFYTHDEEYKGPQANNHWRGFCVLHNVDNGEYDLEIRGIDTL